MASATPYTLRVEGMDCASCALKIETAVRRLPGVDNVNVNVTSGWVSLTVSDPATSSSLIEDKIRALGYTPVAGSSTSAASGAAPGGPSVRAPWWRSTKARLVMLALACFAIAFVLAQFAPAQAEVFYALAAFISVLPFARRAWAGARSGSPFSIETLMTVAVIGAVIIGQSEEAAVVIVLFAVGEWLESFAAGRARAGIESLVALVPRTANRVHGTDIESIDVSALAIGDVVLVRPGDRVPSDGTVSVGRSEVDEAPVTGESVPVLKSVGDTVYAGSVNANGELRVTITREASDNTIARIIHMVEEAQESKAPTARLIDRFSRWYTPAAMAAAALVILIPPLAFDGDWTTWIYRGLATLLIACPCALVISTPAAIASGLAAGARQGLLIKGGAALETLGKVRTVAFDKTGTLTRGAPQITNIVALVGDEDAVLGMAAAVEGHTTHPLGRAIVEAARARQLALPEVVGAAQAAPGQAVTAQLTSGHAAVGSPRYAAELNQTQAALTDAVARLENEGKTVVVVLHDGVAQGVIALRDEPRDDAAHGIRRLTDRGIRAVMLTGDNARSATAIAGQLGLTAHAELMPAAKLALIETFKSEGPVAMVGDGINDAPALATASVGIAMGAGTDVALETADAALLKNRVTGIADLIALSQATLGNIWQNIGIALGLKAIFLATTLTGVTSLWMAILADTGATVLVTANALRLLRHRPKA